MKVIGLTGGIASGKSTVARFLEELGAVAIDLDKVGHETLEPATESWAEVIEAFGKGILLRHAGPLVCLDGTGNGPTGRSRIPYRQPWPAIPGRLLPGIACFRFTG